MADIMSNGQKQILFRGGKLDDKTSFVLDSSDHYDAQQLVAALRGLEFNHDDLDLYFAQGTDNNTDIFWEISDLHSNVTFEFFSLDARPDLVETIEARNKDILFKLQYFYDSKKCQNSKNKKLVEVLGKILKKKSELILYAGFDPTKKVYFPVVIGWGGSFEYRGKGSNVNLTGTDRTFTDDLAPNVGGATEGPQSDLPKLKVVHKPKTFWLLWLLWLLIFLLALIIAFMLIPSCGLGKYFSNCNVTSASTNARELYFGNLSKQLTIKNSLCPSPNIQVETKAEPQEIVAPEITTSIKPEITERLDELDASRSELMVSLVWNTKEDLDLSIICPNGARVFHSKPTLQLNNCGTLDIDANVKSLAEKITERPIEHILLKQALGTFKISVKSIPNGTFNTSGTPTSFVVEVNDFGKIKEFTGTVVPGGRRSFTLVR